MSESGKAVYEVRLRSKRVRRELDSLLKVDYERVLSKLKGLACNPRPQGGEKLHDAIYRIRAGDIRIIYLIDDAHQRIEVGAIRRRSERPYKEIEGLFG